MQLSNKPLLMVAVAVLMTSAAPEVFSFDLPGPKPKKEKKKADDDSNANNSKPADTPPPADSAPAATKDDAPPPADQSNAAAAPVQTIELKYPKSLWDKGGKDMKAGDWIESELPMMAGSTSRQEVLEVGDHYTVVQTTSVMMGQKSQQKMKTIYSEPDPDQKDVEKQRAELKIETKEFPDKLTIKGKEIACTRYETYQDGKLVSKAWVSKDLPLGGAVKAEGADGKVMTQITDFGRGK